MTTPHVDADDPVPNITLDNAYHDALQFRISLVNAVARAVVMLEDYLQYRRGLQFRSAGAWSREDGLLNEIFEIADNTFSYSAAAWSRSFVTYHTKNPNYAHGSADVDPLSQPDANSASKTILLDVQRSAVALNRILEKQFDDARRALIDRHQNKNYPPGSFDEDNSTKLSELLLDTLHSIYWPWLTDFIKATASRLSSLEIGT